MPTLPFLFILATLVSAPARAQELTAEHDLKAHETIRKIVSMSQDGTTEANTALIRKITKAQRQKCPNLEFETAPCFVSECEVIGTGCRVDRVLLFRGENTLFDTPATSAFMRAYWKGYSYASPAREWIERLKSDLGALLPMNHAPESTDLYVSEDPATHKRSWSYGGEETEFSKKKLTPYRGEFYPNNGPAFTLLEALFELHSVWSPPQFIDPAKGPVSLDPFISLSTIAMVGLKFTGDRNDPKALGRFIVLSVPKDWLITDRKSTALSPGSLIDTRKLKVLPAYPEEREIDALFSIAPELIWRVFELTKDRAWQLK